MDALPGRGDTIHLVRWFPSGEGWDHELIEARYLSSTRATLRVELAGEMREFDRAVWSACRRD